MDIFIVSYAHETHGWYCIPVRAPSLDALRAALDAAIKTKQRQQKAVSEMVAYENTIITKPRVGSGAREYNTHPLVTKRFEAQVEVDGPVVLYNRVFPGLSDLASVDQIEVQTVEEWEKAFSLD